MGAGEGFPVGEHDRGQRGKRDATEVAGGTPTISSERAEMPPAQDTLGIELEPGDQTRGSPHEEQPARGPDRCFVRPAAALLRLPLSTGATALGVRSSHLTEGAERQPCIAGRTGIYELAMGGSECAERITQASESCAGGGSA